MRRTAVHGAVGNVAPLTLLLLLTNPVTARPLSFRIDEGPVLNSFLREGPDPKDPTKRYTTTWFDMFRIEGGKIAEHWDGAQKQ